MKEEELTVRDVIKMLISVNVPSIILLAFSGWLAYLDKEWGWPFVVALLCLHTIKSRKERFEEEKEEAIERSKMMKKYGEDLFNKVCKN